MCVSVQVFATTLHKCSSTAFGFSYTRTLTINATAEISGVCLPINNPSEELLCYAELNVISPQVEQHPVKKYQQVRKQETSKPLFVITKCCSELKASSSTATH